MPAAGPVGTIGESVLAGSTLHCERLPAQPGKRQELPSWLPDRPRQLLAAAGLDTLWRHQAEAIDLLHRGRDTIVATGTASGKSLIYQLISLSEFAGDDRATVLYLSPTKALGHDQARSFEALDPEVRIGVLDGDTPGEERTWIRDHAQFVVTNPDLLHASALPRHTYWRRLLANLRLIVVDECHSYRGVFGSHVALILRRLTRLCEHYGASPTVIAASATTGDPAASAGLLVGRPLVPVIQDASPRASRTVIFEQPAAPREGGLGAQGESARLLAEFVAAGLPTMAFVPSRRGVEWVAAQTQELLTARHRKPSEQVLAYRAGFLPEERREIEARLRSGDLLGVASTNALEVGMDISGLDAVVICGWPGRRTSFWQQAGRAGRAGRDSLVVLVAADDPLDSYLVAHPEAVFGEPLEVSVIDPANPSVLAPQLCAAAAELPLTEQDLVSFGPSASTVADGLVSAGLLRSRPRGLFWTDRKMPVGLSDIRAIGGSAVQIVELGTGRLLGTVDAAQAGRTVHAGAVYVHQGNTFLVDELRLAESVALVHQESLDYTTTALTSTSLRVSSEDGYRPLGRGRFSHGTVVVTSHVHSYLRRRADTFQVIGSEPLDLPASSLSTSACWWALPDAELRDFDDLAGAVHAAEHAAIGLLPLVVSCDRWDVGGLSTEAHPDTVGCTAFVYDAYPGGAGFARGGFDRVDDWLPATRTAIVECPCEGGCPRCIQSPKCGNGNEPLDKAGAARLLGLLK